jgi:hypothetical protein
MWIKLERDKLEIGQIYEVMDNRRFVGLCEYIGDCKFKTSTGYIFDGAAIYSKYNQKK